MENIRTKTKSWINLLAFLLTLVFNILGSLGFINGMSQKAVSNKYHTLITPAPMTFSIWGLIYTLVLLSLIMMIVKEKEEDFKKLINIFTPLFLSISLFNMLWIISFSYEKLALSNLFILALLISLIEINKKILENRSEIPYKLPSISFGLYAGWLTIAAVVNIAAFLVSIGWNGLGVSRTIWAPLILFISLIVVILINKSLNNVIYPLPVAWAFFGILMEAKRLGDKIDYGSYIKPVIVIGIVVLLLSSIIKLKNNNFSIIKNKRNKNRM